MNNKNVFIGLSFIFLLTSCQIDYFSSDKLEIFRAKNYLNWLTAYHTQIIKQEFVNNNSIQRPVSTWQLLFKIAYLDENKEMVSCLFYKIPQLKKNRYGILKVVQADENQDCSNLFSQPSSNTLEEIKTLKVFIGEESMIIENKYKVKPYTLTFYLERKGKKKWIEFPLMNLEKGILQSAISKGLHSPFSKKRYSTSEIIRKNPGVFFLSFSKSEGVFFENKDKPLGSFDDDFVEGNLIKCHHVDNNCQTLGEYSCDRCRYGWFEIVQKNCTSGGTKYCGPNNCGEKGWPACLRGYQHQEKKRDNYCIQDSLAGFCRKGFSTYCINDFLVCL